MPSPPGKPQLPGLPATYVEEGSEADTLSLLLLDEPSGLQITLRYTVFATTPPWPGVCAFKTPAPLP